MPILFGNRQAPGKYADAATFTAAPATTREFHPVREQRVLEGCAALQPQDPPQRQQFNLDDLAQNLAADPIKLHWPDCRSAGLKHARADLGDARAGNRRERPSQIRRA